MSVAWSLEVVIVLTAESFIDSSPQSSPTETVTPGLVTSHNKQSPGLPGRSHLSEDQTLQNVLHIPPE